METAQLPNLPAGLEWLTLSIPVDLKDPTSGDAVASMLVDSYDRAVAVAVARTGGATNE